MKYKVIKSAAHNFGHSFTSLMNWRADDYVMSYLARAALASGADTLRVDLVSGDVGPTSLVTKEVQASVSAYVAWLPRLLRTHNVQPEAIVAGGMTLRFDLERASEDQGFPGNIELPFDCTVALLDNRGKQHVGTVTGWWSAHAGGPPPLTWLTERGVEYADPRSKPRHSSRPWWRFWGHAA